MKKLIFTLSLIGVFALNPITTVDAITTVDVTLINGDWESVTGGTSVTGIGTDTITWGTTAGAQSGYSFTLPTATPFTVDLNDQFIFAEFTHNNFPIASGTSITEAFMELEFGLAIDSTPFSTIFEITFDHNETPNTNIPPDDIVTLVDTSLFSASTQINGQWYFIEVLGFQTGPSTIVKTIQTAENAASTFPLIAIVTTPEPKTYLLMSSLVGFVLLVSYRKRKHVKKI